MVFWVFVNGFDVLVKWLIWLGVNCFVKKLIVIIIVSKMIFSVSMWKKVFLEIFEYSIMVMVIVKIIDFVLRLGWIVIKFNIRNIRFIGLKKVFLMLLIYFCFLDKIYDKYKMIISLVYLVGCMFVLLSCS